MFDKSLPMTGFELRISGVGGDRFTTESQPLPKSFDMLILIFPHHDLDQEQSYFRECEIFR